MPLRQLLLAEAEGVDPLGHIGAESGDAFHFPGGEEKGAQQQGRQGDAPQPRAPAQGALCRSSIHRPKNPAKPRAQDPARWVPVIRARTVVPSHSRPLAAGLRRETIQWMPCPRARPMVRNQSRALRSVAAAPPLVQPVPQGDDAVEPQEESLDQAPPAQSQDPPGQKPQPPAHRGPHPRQPGCPAQHLSQHQGQHRSERPGGQRPPLDQQHRQTPRRQQKRGRSVTDQARELRTQPSGPGGGGGQSGHRLLHFRRFSGRKTPFFRVITGKIGGKIAKNRGNRLSR